MQNSWEEMAESQLYQEFGARKAECNDECVGCPYFKFCAGGCPKNRPDRGAVPKQLSAMCRGWKLFYAHTLDKFRQLASEIRRERREALEHERNHQAAMQLYRAGKIGKNSLCPCGSGKKFKQCCARIKH
jgi:uncharacterized protein